MVIQKKIIISHLLGSDPAAIGFLFEGPASLDLRASPGEIAYQSWALSKEAQVLVRAALDVWSGQGNIFLWELLNGLDHQNFSRLLEALKIWRDFNFRSSSRLTPSSKGGVHAQW